MVKVVYAGSFSITIQHTVVHLHVYLAATFAHIVKRPTPISRPVFDGFAEADDPRVLPFYSPR